MPRTIHDAVAVSGIHVAEDDLVNFGRNHRVQIDPTTGPRSYWFRYGDIRDMTLPQIQAAIGGLASAGQPGGAKVMRVSSAARAAFTHRTGSSLFSVDEFTSDVPVMVKYTIDVA
jgi:hypothetical protein